MANPRSSFRFRMPRLRPSVPPPQSTTRTTTRKPSSQPEPPTTPIPPQGVPPPASTATVPAPPPPSPPIPPQGVPPPPTSPATPPAPPVPSQPTPTATVPAPTVPAPAPPLLPPPAPTATVPPPTTIAPAPFVLPPPPPPPPQAAPPSPVASSFTKPVTTKSPKPTKTESQPSSPSQTSIQSRVSSQQPSPSRMSNEPSISAKPPLPSTTPQPPFPTNVQPTSPSPLASENKITSLPQSPIITTPKLQPKEASSYSSLSDISSDNDQKDVDLPLMEQPKIEAPKVEEKHKDAINTTNNNIPNTPKTKSMISQPESPQIPKPINRSEALTDVNENDTSPRKEKPLSVITLAGDNRGTSMHINGAIKQERKIHIHRRYKVDNPDEIEDTTTDGEESSNGKKLEKDSEPTDNLDKNAYINCNIQGINNSMVFNSSFVERNPGVHLGRNPDNVNKSKRKKSKPTDMANSSQKITTIRRRCLRGFFMESSDSDADDPHKPRRHGCRYTGGEKSNKEEKMDVV